MSLAENTTAVARYNWRGLSSETVKAYATTVYKESHRIPDDWSYKIHENGLYDEKRNGYVRDIVSEYPHPNLYLRRVEDTIIDAMDTWAVHDTSRYLVWISPSFSGEYPTHKIEILERSEDGGSTHNMAILFDGDRSTCLNVSKEIFPQLGQIEYVEEIRRSIIILDELDIDRILKIVKPYVDQPSHNPGVSPEVYDYIAELSARGASQNFIANEMRRLGVIGEKSFSCPGGGLSAALESSTEVINQAEDKYGKLSFSCPHCGKVNTRPYGQLISTCHFCGGDVKC